MAHSEQHYRDAANGLKGALGDQFGQSGLDGAEVSRIHRIANFRENAELMGMKGGSVAGVQERGVSLARTVQDTKRQQSENAKRSMDNALFLNLLGQAETYVAQLAADVARIEADYEARYGDAWVETIALEVLGPDEIPERRDGEDILSYRERVRETLLETMIDPATGQVKPEHANSPHKQWAERAWKQEEIAPDIEAMNDESLSQEERQAAAQRVVDTRDQDTIRYANTSNAVGDTNYEFLATNIAEDREETSAEVVNQADVDAFFAPS